MNRYAVLLQHSETPDAETLPPVGTRPTREKRHAAASAPVAEVIDQSATQSTGRPTRESTGRSVSRLGSPTSLPTTNTTVERPKAFYITKRLDQRLENAVRYYQDVHGIKKVDRSAIVNAMLDNDANWTDESLDRAVGRIMSLLTSRLTD